MYLICIHILVTAVSVFGNGLVLTLVCYTHTHTHTHTHTRHTHATHTILTCTHTCTQTKASRLSDLGSKLASATATNSPSFSESPNMSNHIEDSGIAVHIPKWPLALEERKARYCHGKMDHHAENVVPSGMPVEPKPF